MLNKFSFSEHFFFSEFAFAKSSFQQQWNTKLWKICWCLKRGSEELPCTHGATSGKKPSQTIYHVSGFRGASIKKVHYLLASLDRARFFSLLVLSVSAVAGKRDGKRKIEINSTLWTLFGHALAIPMSWWKSHKEDVESLLYRLKRWWKVAFLIILSFSSVAMIRSAG